ncbi:MAG: hypothetical protein SPI35_05850 [Porphyromonas sp.]|nr:hypothetical protein [Porphyromonas sp.]
MITEYLVQSEHIRRTVLESLSRATALMRTTITANVGGAVGERYRSVLSEQPIVRGESITQNIPLGLRLTDIRFRDLYNKKVPLYNHSLFPEIYRVAYPKIRYGLNEGVRQLITETLNNLYGETQ